MSRSVWKGPYVKDSLMKRLEARDLKGDKRPVKTWARSSTVTPKMVGKNLKIHNGLTWVPLTVKAEMVGQKLGAFVRTRKYPNHKVKKAKSVVMIRGKKR